MPQQPTLQEQRLALFAELQQEQDSFLRGTPRAHYYLDSYGSREEVDRVGWRTVMIDRYNGLALACQREGENVELLAPLGLEL